MSLPYFIEYILAIERPGGGRLCTGGISQAIVQAFPPGTTLNLSFTPTPNYYASIWFRFRFSPAIVPNAYTGWIQQFGGMLVTGVGSQLFRDIDIDNFTIISIGQPVRAQIINVSGLVQYYEHVVHFVNIPAIEDYKLLMVELDKLRMGKLETLAAQANALLDKMARELARPWPPVRPPA